MKKNVAIFSPNENAYSESFIQAHKKINANIFFYYDGFLPTQLEGKGVISYNRNSVKEPLKLINRLLNPCLMFNARKLSLKKRMLAYSLKTNKIDYVLAEYGTCAIEVMDICEILNIPLIVHYHGYDISRYSILEKNAESYKKLFHISYKIIAVSRLMERRLIDLGCPSNKIVYNPCGPCDSFYEVTPKYNSNQIIAVGRFVDKKAPYYLILAFNEVLKKVPTAKLRLIGTGPLYETCRNLIKFLGIGSSIDLLGIVDHKDIINYYRESSVFVQSSITALDGDQEGTPVSVMEASLAGLPVVSTIHAGIPDVIKNGVTGLLLEEHDIHGFALAITSLLQDKQYCEILGNAGKSYIYSNYRLSLSIEKINALIV